MKREGTLKKWIAGMLAMVLLLQTTPVVPVSFAAGTQHGDLGDLHLDCYPSVTYTPGAKIREETYQLRLELNAEFYEHAINTDPATPARGYFTTNYDGWYMVELWGGDGADGPSDSGRQGGSGGEGGYVYAKIYLKAGQTLYYSLGGDGQYTYVSGEGGGANGGGNAGSTVTYGVGGGGGYSALFLFPDTEGSNTFENLYLDEQGRLKGDNISEYDRATKYLMIAGGGGGGGAADGAALGASSSSRKPNGGAGGNLKAAVMGTIVGDGLTVAGTYYAGGDGQHSGSSDAYIGHGGTSVPGEVASTAWNWYSGEKPNDWTGAYNNANSGGSGGAGNLRGGSGGGGFCGGSGGIQQSLISATNVGGGGGGSSFVANEANGEVIYTVRPNQAQTGITAEELAVLDGVNDEEGCTGGRVAITYLAGEHHNDDVAKAQDLDVAFTLSPYFNLAGLDFSQATYEVESDGTITGEVNVDYNPSTGYIVFQHVSLVPTNTNLAGNLEITLTLTPKARFMGGNDVPLLSGDKVSVAVAGTAANAEADGVVKCEIGLKRNLCYVNVPLNFAVDVRNHTYTYVPPGDGEEPWSVTLSPDQMHNTAVDAARQESLDSDDPMYYFIEEITGCAVTGMAGPTKISTTTVFPVSFTVTPKDDPAINPVCLPGTIPATIFSADATVTILAPHDGYIHGQKMKFVKDLQFVKDPQDKGNDIYTFSLTTTADNTKSSTRPVYDYDPSNASAGSRIDIEHAGVYLVQVWGGSGHAGVSPSGWSSGADGGPGGAGGYSYVYLPLDVGDYLVIDQMGRQGLPAVSGAGGGGGTYTAVSNGKTDQILAIAGGGGGGGNGVVGGILGSGWVKIDGLRGLDANSDPIGADQPAADLTVYNGGAGGAGSNADRWSLVAGAAGTAGGNYYSSSTGVFRDYDANQFYAHGEDTFTAEDLEIYLTENDDNPSTVAGGGAVKVSCLWLDDQNYVATTLEDYTLKVQLSPYFSLKNGSASVTGQNNAAQAAQAGKQTLEFADAVFDPDTRILTVSDIDPYPKTVVTENGQVTEYHNEIDFTLSLTLVPSTGFLGGNHVPVLQYNPGGDLPYGVEMSQQQQVGDTMGMDETDIKDKESTDYANVPLNTAAIADAEDAQGDTVGLGTVTGRDIHLEQEQLDKEVERDELYSWDPSWPPPGDWTDDYVQKVVIVGERATPAVDVGWTSKVHETNAHYSVTVGVGPTTPAKAGIVGEEAENYTLPAVDANVYVRPRMLYDLTGLKTDHTVGPDHCESMDPTAAFTVTLEALPGHKLPASITVVYNDDSGPVDFAYDSATGKVTILPGAITKSMTLQAAGVVQTYKLYFGHEVQGSTDPKLYSIDLPYDAPIGQAQAHAWEEQYRPADIPGYTFAWNWRTGMETPNDKSDDGLIPDTMPPYDLWVVGEYTPQSYTVVVNYQIVDKNGAITPAGNSSAQVAFGSPFDLTTPLLDNHAADFPVIAGTMDADLLAGTVDPEIYPDAKPPVVVDGENNTVTFTVSYTHTEGLLRVEYYYVDSHRTVIEDYTGDTGQYYTVQLTIPEGYTAHLWDGADYYAQPATQVTVKILEGGVVQKVAYRPRSYTVEFLFDQDDQNPGSCTEQYRPVTYHAEYGQAEPLPTQVLRNGYEFAGWYLADANGQPTGQRIHSDTVVTTAGDHALVAKWTVMQYALVVEHVFADGSKAGQTQTIMVNYGAAFQDYCTPLDLGKGYAAYVKDPEGDYKPVLGPITGTMPAQTVVRTFYYLGKNCNLTVDYVVMGGSAAAPAKHTAVVPYGSSFRVTSPTLADYVCSQPEVSGVMDDLKGKTYTVYYYSDSPEISFTITWGTGDAATDLHYTYYHGEWDPDTHTYIKYRIDPAKGNANRVTVSNDGSKMGASPGAPALNIDAALRYEPGGDYGHIGGYFTAHHDQAAAAVSALTDIVTGTPKNAWLWLTGQMPTTVVGKLPVGRCIISITAAGGVNEP